MSSTLIGFGLAALSVGGIFGVKAILDSNEARRSCPSLRCTSSAALAKADRLEQRARTEARVADVTLPLGALAAGSGGLVLLGWSGTW